MLRICLKDANYFIYEGKFYKQQKGMFMGSSLAPILVERVVEFIVDKALTELKLDPDFWYTFVDDHLTSIPEGLVNTLEKKLNSIEETVQFTVVKETEDTHTIEFLDTKVYRIGNRIRTNWYHKPIASNRLLNYFSSHPKTIIFNTAKAFIRRVYTLSHSSFHKENEGIVKTILMKNSFPSATIEELIKQVRHSPNRHNQQRNVSYPYINETTRMNGTANQSTESEREETANTTIALNDEPVANSTIIATAPRKYAGITYVAGVTEMLIKQLKRVTPNLIISPSPPAIGQIFSDMKHKLTKDEQAMVNHHW